MTNRDRDSVIVSSGRGGRCAMSMVVLLQVLRRPPYDAVRWWCRRGGHLSARPPPRPLQGRTASVRAVGAGVRRLLGVELHDQLLLDRGVDHLTGRDGVHEHAQLAADDLEPRGHGALAGAGLGDLERQHRAALLRHLDDVVLAHAVGRDVDLAAVDPDVAVAHQLAGHVAGLGEAGPVDHVVQPRLQDLEQDLTGLAGLAVGLFVVTAELLLQHAVDAAGLLLLTKLEQGLAVLGAAAAMLARRVGPDLDRALRGLALAALEEQLHLLAPAHAAVGSGVTGHVKYSCFVSSVTGQTRRRFLGRQPLCGCGVTSWICPTSRPVACRERMAVSRPEPGPFTKTSTLRMPCSCALRAAFSAAICAANGVDLREPLKPTWPAEAQLITLPFGSVIDTIVLLNVLLMCAAPWATFFFSLRRTFLAPAAVRALGGMSLRFLIVQWPVERVVRAAPALTGRCGSHGTAYFLPAFFLPAMVLRGPLLERALVLVR